MIGVRILLALITVIDLMMLVRAILSWIPGASMSSVGEFLTMVTEPFIWPMRKLLNRFAFVYECPIDIPYIVTFILLGVIETILSSLL